MTVIVGVVGKDGKVHMGGDLRGSADEEMSLYTTPKVFKKGEFIIGFCGSFRVGDILQHCLVEEMPESISRKKRRRLVELPKEEKEYEKIENFDGLDDNTLLAHLDCKPFLVTELVHCIRKVLKKNKALATNKETDLPEIGSQLLIGYGNKLFMMQEEFSVLENDQGFEAIGAGNNSALGYLQSKTGGKITNKSQENIRRAIAGAIEAASVSISSVSKECIVLSLETDKTRHKIKQILLEREKDRLETVKKGKTRQKKSEEKTTESKIDDAADTKLLNEKLTPPTVDETVTRVTGIGRGGDIVSDVPSNPEPSEANS